MNQTWASGLTQMGELCPCPSQAPQSVQEGDGGGIAEEGGSLEGGGGASLDTSETIPPLLNTPGLEDSEQEGSLSDSLDQSKCYPGHQGEKGKDQGKVQIESSEDKDIEDPLKKITLPSDLPPSPRRVAEGNPGCVF